MAITVKTAPTFEPVSLAEAKLQVRETGTTQDPVITSLISRARIHCEKFTGLTGPQATFLLTLDHFPPEREYPNPFAEETYYRPGLSDTLEIPNAPLISVTHIKYIDTNGQQQ